MCPPRLNPRLVSLEGETPPSSWLRDNASWICAPDLHAWDPRLHLSLHTAVFLMPSETRHRKRRPHGIPACALWPSPTPWDLTLQNLPVAGWVSNPRSTFPWSSKSSGGTAGESQVHRNERDLRKLTQTRTAVLFRIILSTLTHTQNDEENLLFKEQVLMILWGSGAQRGFGSGDPKA